MNQKLRLLFIEDDPNDVFLTINYLKRYWQEINYHVVDKMDDLLAALKQDWQIIISDFYLPEFDGLTALNIVRENGITAPFILVSGQVNEDIASAMMRLGADDYIMKGNLKRLDPEIMRELTPHTQLETAPVAAQPADIAPATEVYQSDEINKLLALWYAERPASGERVIHERHRAVVNIMYLAGLIKEYQNELLKKHNLTEQRLNVLRFLKQVYPLPANINLLKENLVHKTADLSRIVQRMVEEGLISYRVNEKDKRQRDIVIATTGIYALTEMDKVSDLMFLPENYISEEDAKKINEGLAKTLRIMG